MSSIMSRETISGLWTLASERALESGAFRREEVVCTKTLYNYVDLGMLPIKNMDLPEKTRRNIKIKAVRENTHSEKRGEIFKTITADNGSEFANLTFLEDNQLKVYFTHPYSSFEKARWNVTTGC